MKPQYETNEVDHSRDLPWVPYALAAVLACIAFVFLCGCGALSGGLGSSSKGLPVVAIVELNGPDGTQNGWALYDGDLLIAKNGDFVGRAMIVDKASGVTLAIVEFTAKNQILVQSRRRDFKGKFSEGESVPAFVTENYPPLILERYGLIVEGSTSAAKLAPPKHAR